MIEHNQKQKSVVLRLYSGVSVYLLLFLFLLFLLLESLCSFVGSDQLCEVCNVLVGLLQQVGQALILLLVDEFTVALLVLSLGKENGAKCRRVCVLLRLWWALSDIIVSSFYHEPPHPLFLNTLILLLLLPLGVGVVSSHSFGQFLDFACDRTVVLLEVFGVLEDAVEVLLCLNWMKDRKRLSVRSKTLEKYHT